MPKLKNIYLPVALFLQPFLICASDNSGSISLWSVIPGIIAFASSINTEKCYKEAKESAKVAQRKQEKTERKLIVFIAKHRESTANKREEISTFIKKTIAPQYSGQQVLDKMAEAHTTYAHKLLGDPNLLEVKKLSYSNKKKVFDLVAYCNPKDTDISDIKHKMNSFEAARKTYETACKNRNVNAMIAVTATAGFLWLNRSLFTK